jgi:hypothetical protein
LEPFLGRNFMERREVLSSLGAWSGAALAAAGLTGLSTGCAGHRPSPAPSAYADYANYSDYFDYANYINYGDYSDYYYSDYADYANYANYGDYFDYSDAYGDYYGDYSNYANYMNYSDYFDYSDYSDYAKYNDYSDYTNCANYADTYADSGGSGSVQPKLGRTRCDPPRPGLESPLPKGGQEALRGPEWREPSAQVDRSPGSALQLGRPTRMASRSERGDGTARQAAPDQVIRPERQKPGRRSRRMDGEPLPKRPPGRPGGTPPEGPTTLGESPDPMGGRE